MLSRCCFLFILLLSFLALRAQAPPADDGFESVVSFPDRLLGKVGNQARRMEERLRKQSTKYLAKVKKQEQQLYRELYKKDSAQAKALFGNIDSVYAAMDASATQQGADASPLRQYYHGRLDSLQSSLRFLQDGTSGLPKVPKPASGALSNLQGLQARFTEGTNLEQALLARREQLLGPLQQAGLGRSLQRYQQSVQYYQQQLRQARALLDQPDQLALQVLSRVSKLPLFKAFMEKHSAFAAIFPQPDPMTLAANPGSLQTRSVLQQQMGGTLGTTNPQAALQQGVGQAEEQFKALKDKLSAGGWGDAGELPTTNTNEEKTRSLWSRLELGGNLQSTRASNYFPTTSDLGLSVGYKLNAKSIVGIGASYKLGWGRSWRQIKMTHEGMGLRSFLDWRLKGQFWVSGGAEWNYRQRIESVVVLKDWQQWQQSALLGISRKFRVGKMNSEARVLYDFLWQRQQPLGQPVVFRVGYSFK